MESDNNKVLLLELQTKRVWIKCKKYQPLWCYKTTTSDSIQLPTGLVTVDAGKWVCKELDRTFILEEEDLLRDYKKTGIKDAKNIEKFIPITPDIQAARVNHDFNFNYNGSILTGKRNDYLCKTSQEEYFITESKLFPKIYNPIPDQKTIQNANLLFSGSPSGINLPM